MVSFVAIFQIIKAPQVEFDLPPLYLGGVLKTQMNKTQNYVHGWSPLGNRVRQYCGQTHHLKREYNITLNVSH